MNNIILNQLNNVKATRIEFSPDDTEIFIPKTIKISNQALQKGKIYDIKLKPFVLNSNEYSSLSSNWNQGKVPKYGSYTVEIESNIGNMVKVNGVAIEDHTSNFNGYLPHDSFEVIKIY